MRIDGGGRSERLDGIGAIGLRAGEIGARLRERHAGAQHVELRRLAVVVANLRDGAVAQRALERLLPNAFDRNRLQGGKVQLDGILFRRELGGRGAALCRKQIARCGVHAARRRNQIRERDARADGDKVLLDRAGVEGSRLRRERVIAA